MAPVVAARLRPGPEEAGGACSGGGGASTCGATPEEAALHANLCLLGVPDAPEARGVLLSRTLFRKPNNKALELVLFQAYAAIRGRALARKVRRARGGARDCTRFGARPQHRGARAGCMIRGGAPAAAASMLCACRRQAHAQRNQPAGARSSMQTGAQGTLCWICSPAAPQPYPQPCPSAPPLSFALQLSN